MNEKAWNLHTAHCPKQYAVMSSTGQCRGQSIAERGLSLDPTTTRVIPQSPP